MQQREWDRVLIEAFYEHPDAPMWRLYRELSDLDGLKRIPDKFNSQMTVCRFVCALLPKLAGVLWKASIKDVDRIAKVLGNSNIDTVKGSAGLQRERRRNREMTKKSSRDLAANTLAWQAHKDHLQACSRSAWTTCKR